MVSFLTKVDTATFKLTRLFLGTNEVTWLTLKKLQILYE